MSSKLQKKNKNAQFKTTLAPPIVNLLIKRTRTNSSITSIYFYPKISIDFIVLIQKTNTKNSFLLFQVFLCLSHFIVDETSHQDPRQEAKSTKKIVLCKNLISFSCFNIFFSSLLNMLCIVFHNM